MSQGPFHAAHDYAASHPDALALYCSDGRFTRAVEELLAHLGHDRLDTLTVPGGPGLLARSTAAYSEREGASRSASFLIKGHAIREVVLIAHEHCGYYRERLLAAAPKVIEERQHKDLREAAESLRSSHVGLVVHGFFARVVEGKVRFEPAPV